MKNRCTLNDLFHFLWRYVMPRGMFYIAVQVVSIQHFNDNQKFLSRPTLSDIRVAEYPLERFKTLDRRKPGKLDVKVLRYEKLAIPFYIARKVAKETGPVDGRVRVVPDTGQSSRYAIDMQDALEVTINYRAAFPVVYFLRRTKARRPINATMAKATEAVIWKLISITPFSFCSHTLSGGRSQTWHSSRRPVGANMPAQFEYIAHPKVYRQWSGP
ncbi:MAG: hypothetical protein C7B45_09755 [Sulfobacillus acidophilus]|uniref:Uncharacterized protein n=1 Tax=Sulfobacillus acidophilus TaxID=53633 RepID=A0A2T2WHH5_9FIRM|nr:MAG: hypothetical protein C7B45_09755 [Sulfobacillus acidophilus]